MENNFGFIIKNHEIGESGIGQPFFHKTVTQIHQTVDSKYSAHWREKIYTWDTFVIPGIIDVSVSVPLVDGGVDVTNAFKLEIVRLYKLGTITEPVKEGLLHIVKHYDCYNANGIIGFKKRRLLDEDIVPAILMMKLWIMGFHRFNPIKTKLKGNSEIDYWGFTHFIGQEDRSDFRSKHGDATGLKFGEEWKFTRRGKEYSTPMWGCYAHDFIDLIFGDMPTKLPSGKKMQNRQQRFLMDFGWVNYLVANRGAGKGYILSLLASLQAYAETANRKHILGENRVAWGAPDLEVARTMLERINGSLRKNEYFNSIFNVNVSSNTPTISVNDLNYVTPVGRTVGVTVQGSNLLRGTRGTMMIDDEAANPPTPKADGLFHNTLETWVGEGALQFNVSTFNEETTDGRFTKNAMEAVIQSAGFSAMEDAVLDIWYGLGIDKLGYDDFYTSKFETHTKNILLRARQMLMESRPLFGATYDIYSCEYLTPEQLKKKITPDASRTIERIQTEELCRIFKQAVVLDPRGNILSEEETPGYVSDVVLAWDLGGSVDQAAACVLGGNQDNVYVLEGHILSDDKAAQYEEIKLMLKRLKTRYSQDVTLLVDAKGQDMFNLQTTLEQHGLTNYILMGAHHGEATNVKINQNKGYISYGKKVSVSLCQEALSYSVLKICSGNEILLQQMQNFVSEARATGAKTFKGKGKARDDLVSAMLMGFFYLYDGKLGLGYKSLIANSIFIEEEHIPTVAEIYRDNIDVAIAEQKMLEYGYKLSPTNTNFWSNLF